MKIKIIRQKNIKEIDEENKSNLKGVFCYSQLYIKFSLQSFIYKILNIKKIRDKFNQNKFNQDKS